MSLLKLFEQINGSQELAIATITDKKNDGKLIAKTPSDAVILLKGDMEIGKKCFYDRRTSTITGVAPNSKVREYGV